MLHYFSNVGLVQGHTSRSSTVILTNSPFVGSGSSATPQTVVSFAGVVASAAAPQSNPGGAVGIQYVRSPASATSLSVVQRPNLIQTQLTPQQRLQVFQQQSQQIATTPMPNAGTGGASGLTLFQMPNGQYVVQQQQQTVGTSQQIVGSGQIVYQQQPLGGVQQLVVQPHQQQLRAQQQTLVASQAMANGQIVLQAQQQQMTGQVVVQQPAAGQHPSYVGVPQTAGLAARPPQINLGAVRGIQLPNGEVQLVGATQVGIVGNGSLPTQSQQIVLQQPQQSAMATIMQGNAPILQGNSTVVHGSTSVVQGSTGTSNVIYQTMPLTGGAGCISATNFVQINQFSGAIQQQQQVPQQVDQQSSGIVLSLNQPSSPAASVDQLSDRSGMQNGNNILVQINGQTYRLQNVQQTPVTAANTPVQVMPSTMQSSMQMVQGSPRPVAQQMLQPQQHPVQVMQINQSPSQQSSAQVVHAMSPARVVSPAVPLRQLAPGQVLQPVRSALTVQPAQTGSSQPAARVVHQAIDTPIGLQPVTLTPSQRAAIQQAPPDKQLKLLQLLQRQQAQRAAAAVSAAQPALSHAVVANGHPIQISTVTNGMTGGATSTASLRVMPSSLSLTQQSPSVNQPVNSIMNQPVQGMLPRPMQSIPLSAAKTPSIMSGLQLVRSGQNIVIASQGTVVSQMSTVRTVGPASVANNSTRILPRPPLAITNMVTTTVSVQPAAAQQGKFIIVQFTEPSRHRCNLLNYINRFCMSEMTKV